MSQNYFIRVVKITALILVLAATIIACTNASPTPTPTLLSTATPKPTNTPKPTFTPSPTATYTPSPTATITRTPRPTNTPLPEVDLESFVFPYDVTQVLEVWDQLQIPSQYRYFTYHITNRISRAIPYGEPCGYHPGDVIYVLGMTRSLDNFIIDVKLPYSGTLVDSWKTQGGDDGFTFFIGSNAGKEVYLNAYHTTESHISIDQSFEQGDVFGSLTYTTNHGGWNTTVVHFTLFNPAPSGGTDFLGDDIAVYELASYALPPTLQTGFENDINTLITYEGPDWCNMSSQQKIDTILTSYLPNAGFCVDGRNITYCGINSRFAGIQFTYSLFDDGRSIMLRPNN